MQEFLSDQQEILRTFYYRCLLLADELRLKHSQEQQQLLITKNDYQKKLPKKNLRHCLISLKERRNSSTDTERKRTAEITIEHHREFVENLETVL